MRSLLAFFIAISDLAGYKSLVMLMNKGRKIRHRSVVFPKVHQSDL